MKKRRIVLLAVIAILAVGIAFPFLRAAYRMKVYLRVVDPLFAPYVKLFATYNPVDGNFNMHITKPSGDSIFLECTSDGRILDDLRADRYWINHDIRPIFEAEDNSVGYLNCCWYYDSPEEPVFYLRILLGDYIPATDEAKLEQALKTLLLTHYNMLPEIVTEHPLTCRIGRGTASMNYRLIVSTTAGDDFPSILEQSKLEKEEKQR